KVTPSPVRNRWPISANPGKKSTAAAHPSLKRVMKPHRKAVEAKKVIHCQPASHLNRLLTPIKTSDRLPIKMKNLKVPEFSSHRSQGKWLKSAALISVMSTGLVEMEESRSLISNGSYL